ncbi:MAG: ChaN family lipoprotein [Sulfurimonas sp.]|nr:ChaN family lipoprotein [Sulfurimonas sp.]
MKKALILLTLILSSLYAHECRYSLKIDLDIDKGLLKGHATIQSDHPSMKMLDTKAKITEIKNATLSVDNNIPYLVKEDVNKDVEMTFTYGFKSIKGDAILLEAWYPRIDVMCKHETVISNSEAIIVTEATRTEGTKEGKSFIFDYPLDRLHIIASKNYTVNSTTANNGMKLSTYFYPDDSSLSKRYFDKSEEYFNLYREMFGFLPFKQFSIVETPFPAGYSMPTYTLIGKQIINKDFVLENSLGHEIAHQWFGNYVYTPDVGNWVEGINTFYSDYLYAKKEGRAADYRKEMLVKYNSYVNPENEIALIEFTSKTQESKNAVGYGKATIFFYMLEQKIGKKAFAKGTKKLLEKYPFEVATYRDLMEVYEEVSGEKLLDFFKTWVYSKGALDFKINNLNLSYLKNRYILEFEIVSNLQQGFLPMKICSDKECLSTKIDLRKKNMRIELDIEPSKIIFDENYEVFRKLYAKEISPVISRVLKSDIIAVIDRADEKKFENMKHVYKNFKYADTITFEELKNNNILVLGANNSLLNQISIPFKMEDDAKFEMFKNPLNSEKVLAVFDMKKLSRSIFYQLKHLGKYSSVVFKDGVITKKTIKPSQKGIIYELNSGSLVIKPKAKKFSEISKELVKSRVVFVGEKHTEFSSHLNQLKIIKAMYKNNPKLSIGMEMFQKPFQKYLDAFIAGKIDEKEMVAKTEYFKRWKYDYELYRPIMLFAKENNIPIIALNIDREITKIVVSKGLDALNDKQRSEVPNSIDFSNEKYKEYLMLVYSMHQSKNFKNFDEFYHAQLLWDESMAKNIVDYMQKNPEHSMAVLAGNGHIMHGYGIPSRINRRGISDYTITLNLTSPETGIADYLLYPSAISTKKAKKLGVFLESDENLKVIKLVKKSIASKAEIKVGDTIVSFNGTPIKSIFDLKTELAFIEGSVKLKLIRDLKEISVDIKFDD